MGGGSVLKDTQYCMLVSSPDMRGQDNQGSTVPFDQHHTLSFIVTHCKSPHLYLRY